MRFGTRRRRRGVLFSSQARTGVGSSAPTAPERPRVQRDCGLFRVRRGASRRRRAHRSRLPWARAQRGGPHVPIGRPAKDRSGARNILLAQPPPPATGTSPLGVPTSVRDPRSSCSSWRTTSCGTRLRAIRDAPLLASGGQQSLVELAALLATSPELADARRAHGGFVAGRREPPRTAPRVRDDLGQTILLSSTSPARPRSRDHVYVLESGPGAGDARNRRRSRATGDPQRVSGRDGPMTASLLSLRGVEAGFGSNHGLHGVDWRLPRARRSDCRAKVRARA